MKYASLLNIYVKTILSSIYVNMGHSQLCHLPFVCLFVFYYKLLYLPDHIQCNNILKQTDKLAIMMHSSHFLLCLTFTIVLHPPVQGTASDLRYYHRKIMKVSCFGKFLDFTYISIYSYQCIVQKYHSKNFILDAPRASIQCKNKTCSHLVPPKGIYSLCWLRQHRT